MEQSSWRRTGPQHIVLQVILHFESIVLGWDGIDCWYWCPFVCCDMHRSPFTICSANWNALMEDSGFDGTVDQSDKPS